MRRGSYEECYDRIRREEVIIFYFTNIVFFFAGNITVTMHHQVFKLLWVVLALCAHSHEGTSMVSTSMATWRCTSVQGSASSVWTCKFRRIVIKKYYPTLPLPKLSMSSQHEKVQIRNNHSYRYTGRLPSSWYVTCSSLWHLKMGIMKVLETLPSALCSCYIPRMVPHKDYIKMLLGNTRFSWQTGHEHSRGGIPSISVISAPGGNTNRK